MPPPGSYEVCEAYENSQIKRGERTKPRTDEASRKQGSFLTAASRFAPSRDIVVAKPDLENPGKLILIVFTGKHGSCDRRDGLYHIYTEIIDTWIIYDCCRLGATSGAGTTYPQGAPEFTLSFFGIFKPFLIS